MAHQLRFGEFDENRVILYADFNAGSPQQSPEIITKRINLLLPARARGNVITEEDSRMGRVVHVIDPESERVLEEMKIDLQIFTFLVHLNNDNLDWRGATNLKLDHTHAHIYRVLYDIFILWSEHYDFIHTQPIQTAHLQHLSTEEQAYRRRKRELKRVLHKVLELWRKKGRISIDQPDIDKGAAYGFLQEFSKSPYLLTQLLLMYLIFSESTITMAEESSTKIIRKRPLDIHSFTRPILPSNTDREDYQDDPE